MELSGWLGGAVVVAAVAVITAARWMSKRDVLRGREPVGLAEMYQQGHRLEGSYEVFERVFNMVGEAYHVDPRLLRPSDKLKKLYDLDSWDLGEGTEQLNRRIADEFGVTGFDAKPTTIAELVAEMQKRHA